MKTFKIRTAKICVIILNDHLTNCAKAHLLLELFFFSFYGTTCDRPEVY